MKLIIIILIFITYFALWCMLKTAKTEDEAMEKLIDGDK